MYDKMDSDNFTHIVFFIKSAIGHAVYGNFEINDTMNNNEKLNILLQA